MDVVEEEEIYDERPGNAVSTAAKGTVKEILSFRPGVVCGGKLSKKEVSGRSSRATEEALAEYVLDVDVDKPLDQPVCAVCVSWF